MNTEDPRKNIHRSESEWREIFEAYQESGLSINMFCQERGIPASSYRLWNNKFASIGVVAPLKFIKLKKAAENEVPSLSPLSNSLEIEIDLGSGLSVRIRR